MTELRDPLQYLKIVLIQAYCHKKDCFVVNVAFLCYFKYNTNTSKQSTCMLRHQEINTHKKYAFMRFPIAFCVQLNNMWDPLGVSKYLYGSSGTDALSSLSKWFYKQFSEAWCLLTWNLLLLSLTYYQWYNLFSGNWCTDQWFPWLNLLLSLKMGSQSSKRESPTCLCLSVVDFAEKTSRNSYIRKKTKLKPKLSLTRVFFSKYFWFWLSRF